MKKTKINNFKLGIFVVAGLLVFTLSIYLVGRKQNLFGSTFKIYGVFRNVTGLQVGNNVRFSGIAVGTVDAIEIVSDTTVRVEMIMEKSVLPFIKKDASAVVGAEGLMGNKIININAGTPGMAPIANNATIRTETALDMDALMLKLQTTINNTNSITGDIAVVTRNIKQGKGTIGTFLSDEEFAGNIKQTMRNVTEGSRTITNQMQAITNDVQGITYNLKAGKGPLGTLMNDSNMSRDLRGAVHNVSEGAKGFEQNMTALQHSFLLRRYFRKEDKALEEKLERDIKELDEIEDTVKPVKVKKK